MGEATETCDAGNSDSCFEWGDFARLYVTSAKEENGNCATVEWYSPYARRLEDCFYLDEGVHWYGGGGPFYYDVWPKEGLSRPEGPMVPGDGWVDAENGGVSEHYWLISSGVAIHAEEENALFFSMNSTRANRACLVAEDKFPYKRRGEVRLKYDLCVGGPGETFKEVHQRAARRYYALPSGIPDVDMMTKPFYSTWAEYKMYVNETVILELARDLLDNGFTSNSHIEIDDKWEACYGNYLFDSEKFPDPAGMTAKLRELGFRTTVWTTPFINIECEAYLVALNNGYLVKDEKGIGAMTSWWQGAHAGVLDFTNEEAVAWWSGRLKQLQSQYGIDSFKFDAGEFNWIPASYQFTGNPNTFPAIATTKYVEACAEFGGLIEVRSARQNQNLAIFVRMLDKDSRWGYDNGLQSVIPTLFDFGIKGYPFIMPDMIGGNAYGDGWVGDRPAKQLYIRWMQMNAFMPSLQFSVLPWHYDDETMGVVKEVLALREEFRPQLLAAAAQAVKDGSPINRPLWWVDPTDANTLTIDDQYMLGDDILVAPVLKENATSRDIYFPAGSWVYRLSDSSHVLYQGPMKVENFSAPIDVLPFFVRETK